MHQIIKTLRGHADLRLGAALVSPLPHSSSLYSAMWEGEGVCGKAAEGFCSVTQWKADIAGLKEKLHFVLANGS